MRRRSIEVDLLLDPLPHALEGGLCDRFFSIADDVAVELAARLKEGRKLLIKRNEPVSSFTLGLSNDRPVVPVNKTYYSMFLSDCKCANRRLRSKLC